MLANFVLLIFKESRVLLLIQMRLFSPYIKNAFENFGGLEYPSVGSGSGHEGQEKIDWLDGTGELLPL